jgi:hypothetical protein
MNDSQLPKIISGIGGFFNERAKQKQSGISRLHEIALNHQMGLESHLHKVAAAHHLAGEHGTVTVGDTTFTKGDPAGQAHKQHMEKLQYVTKYGQGGTGAQIDNTRFVLKGAAPRKAAAKPAAKPAAKAAPKAAAKPAAKKPVVKKAAPKAAAKPAAKKPPTGKK